MKTLFKSRTEARPMIYACAEDNPRRAGYLKVGFASSDVEKRVAEQFPILKPGTEKPYKIVFAESALYDDGGSFTDRRVSTTAFMKIRWRRSPRRRGDGVTQGSTDISPAVFSGRLRLFGLSRFLACGVSARREGKSPSLS